MPNEEDVKRGVSAYADCGSVTVIESLFGSSTTIAYARFTHLGVLLAANPQFKRISDSVVGESNLVDLVIEGQRDKVVQLLKDSDTQSMPPNIHFSVGNLPPVTLLTHWVCDRDEIIMLGETPCQDIEAAQSALLKLNSRVSDLARENAKKSAQLEKALNDLKQAQVMLVHREKMVSLGQMTAGIAHELNNPLSYIKNNIYVLRTEFEGIWTLLNLFGDSLDTMEKMQPGLFDLIMEQIESMDLPNLGDQIPNLLESLDGGVDRAAALVNSLRTFSRLDEAELKVVDINETVRAVVDFTGFLVKENGTELRVDYSDVPPILCSPGQLNQALLNILANAIQSSAPNGKVVVSTRLAGDEILIAIADDGPGVPADIADRIFDPFFTTREVGDGMGLGLSIAQSVIAAQGGSISFESEQGHDTVFTIHLPLREKEDL